MKEYENHTIDVDDYTIYLNGYFKFTDLDKCLLVEQFESLKTDILSPLIKNNNQLIYFGGYYKNNNIYYLDERLIKLADLNESSNFYFSRQTNLHFQDLFICTREFYQEHIHSIKTDLDNLKQFCIYTSPFIQINTGNNYERHNIINPYSFDNRHLETSFSNIHTQLSSFKMETYKSHLWNQKKNTLLLLNSHNLQLIKDNLETFTNLNHNLYIFKSITSEQKDVIDYLRSRGLIVNIHTLKLEIFLKNNFNLFDYILIFEDYYLDKLKLIAKINRISKIIDLRENIPTPLVLDKISPINQSLKTKKVHRKVCLIYQCFYQLNNAKQLLNYFEELNNNYNYHLLLINNNAHLEYLDFKNKETRDDITYLIGNNESREMSGYQCGVDYLRDENKYRQYRCFILLNETVFTNSPLHIVNNLNYDHINRAYKLPLVLGKIDKFRGYIKESNYYDKLKLEKWVRSNFILMNVEIFEKLLNYQFSYYKPNKYIQNKRIEIPINRPLKQKLIKRLNKPRYCQYSQYERNLKMLSILNEFHLSNYLLSYYDLTPI